MLDILYSEVEIITDNLGGAQMLAYCLKRRTKKEMKDAKAIAIKNKKLATQGVCPKCGTKMFRKEELVIYPKLDPPPPT